MSAITKVRFGAEWINNFHSDSCWQNNLSYRDDHANGFCEKMRYKGHIQVFNWGNDNAWETDFRHPSSLDWVENVHFCFYSDHGGNDGSTMNIYFSKAKDSCSSSTKDWKLGIKMLKWLVLDCCNCLLNTSSEHVTAVWFPPAYNIHMIFGYVGLGKDGSWTDDVGSDFGEDAAQGNNLGNAWLDAAYSYWSETVAVVLAYGATQNEAVIRRDNENINWRDFNVSSANWLAWKWRS